jgi:hypothetical protein
MKKIQTRKDLKEYYFHKDVVETYIEERFKYPFITGLIDSPRNSFP